jgi:hypothetical protein
VMINVGKMISLGGSSCPGCSADMVPQLVLESPLSEGVERRSARATPSPVPEKLSIQPRQVWAIPGRQTTHKPDFDQPSAHVAGVVDLGCARLGLGQVAKVCYVSSDGCEMVTSADEVAERWRELRAQWDRVKQPPRAFAGLYPLMADMINAAYAVPVLRQLFAGTSHLELHFWACPVHNWSADDIPYIEPCLNIPDGSAGPGYIVRQGRDVIGEADDAGSAITLLLAHLPANVGPVGACRHVRDPSRPGQPSPAPARAAQAT